MFSSNQEFKISGDFSQLKHALQFALEYSGNRNFCFQRTGDSYCIGWMTMNPKGEHVAEKGWVKYQFDFDYDIVAKIVEQEIRKIASETKVEDPFVYADGGSSLGFIIENIPGLFSDEWHGIKKPFYGIIRIQPFYNYYAK